MTEVSIGLLDWNVLLSVLILLVALILLVWRIRDYQHSKNYGHEPPGLPASTSTTAPPRHQ